MLTVIISPAYIANGSFFFSPVYIASKLPFIIKDKEIYFHANAKY